jgi:AcrR family transcriptional regulator
MAERLTRARWIEEGLNALKIDGPSALAADRMAKRLGVTRGSFYWHFANALDFEAAVLGEWEERWTNRIIAAVENGPPSPDTKLKSLIQKTGGLDASIYASAKRMAQNHPELSALMNRVDSRRIDFVTSILESAGIPAQIARLRARIVYSWAMGQMLTSSEGAPVPTEVTDALSAFALKNPKSSVGHG